MTPVVIEPPEVSTDLEGLVLNGLNLNDGITRIVQDLSFKPAEAKPQWADNTGADGAALVQEPHYTNAVFELTIRTQPTTTSDEALEVAGELTDAVQSCARSDGGVPLEWTPSESSKTYTWYAVLGELTELPTEMTGDAAGWLLKAPLARIRLTCRPFGYLPPRTVLEAIESGAEPLQVVYLTVGGDVPAEARLLVTDKSTQTRRYLEWGREVVASAEGNPGLVLDAGGLDNTNYTGTLTTRSGAWPEEYVQRAAAVGQPTTIATNKLATGNLVGAQKVYARVYAASETARFRLSYRVGEGPLTQLAFVQPPVVGGFSRIYLGEATFDVAELGKQKSELRVETKSSDGTPITVDLNYLELIPSNGGSARVRGVANNDNPTKLLAYDNFVQLEGNLAGQTLPSTGTWAGAGDADDFKVIAAEALARRSAVSDESIYKGRFAIAGSWEPTNAKASITVYGETPILTYGTMRRGVLLRYVDTENYLLACYLGTGNEGLALVEVFGSIAGTPTVLGFKTISDPHYEFRRRTISLQATDTGNWSVWYYNAELNTIPTPILEGHWSQLATGGALAKGKSGFYDAQESATANNRFFDNFSLLEAEPTPVVLYSGKTAEIRSDGYFREDPTGKYYGELAPRGADLYLEPEGESGAINQLVLAARRNDVELEEDANVTDKTSVEVQATERFLAPKG